MKKRVCIQHTAHVMDCMAPLRCSIAIGLICSILVVTTSLSTAHSARPLSPEWRLTSPDDEPAVYGQLYLPTTTEPAPGVVILHGRSGIYPAYRQLARVLAEQGYAALVVDYHAETRPLPPYSKRSSGARRPIWVRAVQQSLRYLQTRPEVDAHQIGLVGFSIGASLAIETAGRNSAVKAVVAYYGSTPALLKTHSHRMPPLLILHGEKDRLVPVAHAHTIHDTLTSLGKTVTMQLYPEVGHGFNLHIPLHQPQVAADAQQRTLAFLAQYLKPVGGVSRHHTIAFPRSGTLSEAAVHFYMGEGPTITLSPAERAEAWFNSPVIDRKHYTYTDTYGRLFDAEERRDERERHYARRRRRGYRDYTLYKIDEITLANTHTGTVAYTTITTWEHAASGTRGLVMQAGMSSWKKQDGQWHIITVKEEQPYRAYAR